MNEVLTWCFSFIFFFAGDFLNYSSHQRLSNDDFVRRCPVCSVWMGGWMGGVFLLFLFYFLLCGRVQEGSCA